MSTDTKHNLSRIIMWAAAIGWFAQGATWFLGTPPDRLAAAAAALGAASWCITTITRDK